MTNQNRHILFSNAIIAVAILILPATLTVFCSGIGQQPVDVNATIAAGIEATRQVEINLQATINAAVAATQAANQSTGDQLPEPTIPPMPISPTPVTAIPDPQQVRTVILNEVNGAMVQDLALLKSLYEPDAVIIDHSGTPDNPDDDTVWRGWTNIERRYLEFFSAGYSSLELVDLSIQVDGNQATGVHQGAILDGELYEDIGIYSLERSNGQWLITRLEYGNIESVDSQISRDDGLYILEVGDQHRYEEPWGWDRGDPCEAWASGNFDDTKPNYRGFNVELLLTNNSETKVPDAWPISFVTASGKSVKACYYGYEGSGPPPGATSSVTFFTVVEQDDFVETITFSLNDQTIRLCLDGQGGWSQC